VRKIVFGQRGPRVKTTYTFIAFERFLRLGVRRLVFTEIVALYKGFIAVGARVSFRTRVYQHVVFQCTLLTERFPTYCTLERRFLRVDVAVLYHVRLRCECFIALIAGERSLAGMRAPVDGEIELTSKGFVADIAFEAFTWRFRVATCTTSGTVAAKGFI